MILLTKQQQNTVRPSFLATIHVVYCHNHSSRTFALYLFSRLTKAPINSNPHTRTNQYQYQKNNHHHQNQNPPPSKLHHPHLQQITNPHHTAPIIGLNPILPISDSNIHHHYPHNPNTKTPTPHPQPTCHISTTHMNRGHPLVHPLPLPLMTSPRTSWCPLSKSTGPPRPTTFTTPPLNSIPSSLQFTTPN